MYLDLFSSNRLDAEPPMMLLTGDDPQVVFCTQVLTLSHQFAGRALLLLLPVCHSVTLRHLGQPQ